MGAGFWTSGTITTTSHGTSANWNTAYTTANAALPKAGGTMTGELNVTHNGGVTGSSAPSYSQANIEVQTNSNHAPAIGFHRGGYSASTLYEYDGQLYINAWVSRAQNGLILSSGNYSSYAVPLSGGTMSGTLTLTGGNGNAGSGLQLYETGAHQYPQIYSNGNLEAMWNYRNSGSQWYVGIRTSSQLLGTTGFHFYNTTSAQTVGGFEVGGNFHTIGSVTAAGSLYHTDWVRNHSNNNGHYWSNTGWHLYPQDTTKFYIRSGSTAAVGLNLYASNATRGYVYANSSNHVGFLNNGGNWKLRVSSGDYTEVLGSKLKLNDTSAYIHGGTITSRLGSRFIDVGYSGSCYIQANRTDSSSASLLMGSATNMTGLWSRVGTTNGGASHSSSGRTFKITMGNTTAVTVATNSYVTLHGGSSSDIILKKNIEDHSYGIDAVNNLKPRKFDWKDHTLPQEKQVGFIAQELEEVVPEAVYGFDGAKAIMPSAMISVLTKAIQELSQQVTDLKAEVELLKQ